MVSNKSAIKIILLKKEAILSQKSRNKGHKFEREIAKRLRKVFPEARRQLEYHQNDANGVDIQQTGRYRIQCKRFKKYAPVSCIEEVQLNGPDEVPVLVTKGDNAPILAVLPFDELLRLLENDLDGDWI